jgi:hypothetical protein
LVKGYSGGSQRVLGKRAIERGLLLYFIEGIRPCERAIKGLLWWFVEGAKE